MFALEVVYRLTIKNRRNSQYLCFFALMGADADMRTKISMRQEASIMQVTELSLTIFFCSSKNDSTNNGSLKKIVSVFRMTFRE